jgi:hypothetical protein
MIHGTDGTEAESTRDAALYRSVVRDRESHKEITATECTARW